MSKVRVKTIAVYCPACDSRIRFGERPELFDIVICPECEESSEVVGLSPIELQWSDDSSFEDEEFVDGDDRW